MFIVISLYVAYISEIYCTVSICLHGDPFSIEIGAGSSCPMMDDTTSTRRDLVMELYNFVKDGNLGK